MSFICGKHLVLIEVQMESSKNQKITALQVPKLSPSSVLVQLDGA